MRGEGPQTGNDDFPGVLVVPTAGALDVGGALEGAGVWSVEHVDVMGGGRGRWTPDPEMRVGCIVASHDPPAVDGLSAVRRVRDRVGDAVPAVLVVPPRVDTTAVERALDGEVTDYVRAFGDWEEHLRTRVRARVAGGASTFRELYHNTNEGLLLHDPTTGDVRHVNDRFREMLGLAPGTDVELSDIVAEDTGFTAERAREMVREAARDGRQVFEWLDETADGDTLWTEVSLQRVTVGGEEYVMAAVRDISDRKARERELEDTRRRLDETLERVEEAFFGLDEDWRFTYVNEQAADLLEVDRESAVGASVWEEFPEAVDTIFQREYEAAMAEQETRSFESYYPPLETWFEVRAYPDGDGLSVFFRDVTERKEREHDLELYEAVFENVRERLFVLRGYGEVAFATERFAEWLGVDRSALVGEPLGTHLSPSAVAAIRNAVDDIHEDGGVPTTVQSETVAADRWRDVEVTVTLLPDSVEETVLCSVRDVTDRETAERSRDALVKNVPGMVYQYRTDVEEMAFVSGACHSLTGYEPSALTGGGVSWGDDVVHPEDRESLRAAQASASENHESFTVTYRVVRADGRTRWVREYGRPVAGPDGSVDTLEGILVDVTDERTRERQRTVLNRVLRHNLRNEVQAILGFAAAIREDVDDEQLAAFADRIVESGQSLAELSDAAGRIENTIGDGAESRPVAVEPCLRAVAERARRAHPDVTVHVESTDAEVLAGDRLETALDELVENAAVHNAAPTIHLRAEATADRVAIRVEDDGEGLPAREQSVVTDEREITQLNHGQGLGLWLAKWVVESYGGELGIAVDGGTCITLSLPRAD